MEYLGNLLGNNTFEFLFDILNRLFSGKYVKSFK